MDGNLSADIQLTSIARIRSNFPNEELPTQLLPYRDLSILITGKYTTFSKVCALQRPQITAVIGRYGRKVRQ